MASDVYIRKENAMCSIPQRFADEKIGKCPFCKTAEPKWLYREEWKLFGSKYYFKCPCCESEIMVMKDDVTGLAYAPKSAAGKKKARQGKILNQPYLTVVKIGYSVKTPQNMMLIGEEMTLSELRSRTGE